MTYLLDTNVCIKYLNGKAPKVRLRLQSHRPEEIRVCSIVKGELFAGARKSTNPARRLARQQAFLAVFASLPFDDAAADAYGRIRAAIALANDCTPVTDNTREFSRVPGLAIENWEM